MIPRGAKGLLYRPFGTIATQASGASVDRNGDPVVSGQVVRPTSNGTYVGEVLGILMGGPAATQAMARRGESSDTTGTFGIPTGNEFMPKYNDRLVIGPETYKVGARPKWNYSNSLTTTPAAYEWISVEATTSD